MKTSNVTLLTAIIIATAFTFFSCSSDGGGGGDDTGGDISGGNNLVKKEKINGFSQKGPFVRGSSITLYELDSNLVQTGKSFESTIADDKGSFEINGIQLVSPYVRLKTNGYYYNEVSGKKSASPITLYAIADLTNKNSLNVNLLTHLEHERVQTLVGQGKSVSEAKKQAQQEILKIFGIDGNFADSEDMSIFGTNEGSAALLAISILFQGERDEASFTDLLADFNQAIKNSSEWSNAKKTEMADWISGTNLESIRANINGWGLSFEIPIFEKHVRKFWSGIYDLGECKPAGNGHMAKNANPLSVNKDRNYVCNGSYWESAENPSSSSIVEPSSSSGTVNVPIQRLIVGGTSSTLGSFVDLDDNVTYTRSQVNTSNAYEIDIVYDFRASSNGNIIWDACSFGYEYGCSVIAPLSVFVNAATVAMAYDILIEGRASHTEAAVKDWLNLMADIAPGGSRENEFYNSDYEYINLATDKVFVALTEEDKFFVIAVDTANQPVSISISYLNLISD